MGDFIRGIPKAELHLHVEGTLEPEMMMELAGRNGVALRYSSIDEIRKAYEFSDLQSFLDVYYEAARVLLTERDFHDLTAAYLRRAAADGVRHAEIFFDPQSHTGRGVPFGAVVTGIRSALEEGHRNGISSKLILCFLRDLSADAAMVTLDEAAPYLDWIAAVGLDSAEVGHPPQKFAEVFARARAEGLRAVAHAGEEGPPAYVADSLDVLRVERIDHGVRAEEDEELLDRLVAERIPLTMCPLSNVKLRVFDRIDDHNLKRLLDRGVMVTINSDDPAYFGGYVGDNYLAVQRAFGLGTDDLHLLAANSIRAAFVEDDEKARLLADLDEFVAEAEAPGSASPFTE